MTSLLSNKENGRIVTQNDKDLPNNSPNDPTNSLDLAGPAESPNRSASINLPSPLMPIRSPPAEWSRSAMMRKCAHAFVMALATPEFDSHTFLRTFMTYDTCRITHYGPSWATKKLPYLSTASNSNGGTDYVGRDGCLKYFDLLGSTLKAKFHQDSFPPDNQLCVDAEAELPGSKLTGRVCVDGRGRFEHQETGWRWEESFMYRLSGFDEDGRVEHWEIWSDTLNAYSAAEQKP